MATYKGIQGYTVQKLSSDPTVADTVGQLWYNSTSGKFKISTEGAGAWASGTAAPTATNQAVPCKSKCENYFRRLELRRCSSPAPKTSPSGLAR